MKLQLIALLIVFNISNKIIIAQKDTNTIGENISLIELSNDFPTDKNIEGHEFVRYYDRLFEPLRSDSIKFLEIGILNGVSHLMWKEYFSKADIYGIDIRDYSIQSKGSGITTFRGDQSNRYDLERFIKLYGGGFDVILDDGGHAMDQQQISLGFLFQYIKPGGIFIIEDIHSSLPKFYPDSSFKVNSIGDNTTLFMIEWFIRTGLINSKYMSKAEILYLQENIENVELNFRKNKNHSIMCIITKKG